MGVLASVKEWVTYTNRFSPLMNDRREAVPRPKLERWREHEIARPGERCEGHSKVWTMAPGIWYCRTCHEWFRTWEKWPIRPARQKEGY